VSRPLPRSDAASPVGSAGGCEPVDGRVARPDARDTRPQARTADKAALEKSLRLALDSVKQAKLDKEGEMRAAKLQATAAQNDLEKAQRDLSTVRVEIRKHERHGFKTSIERTHKLVSHISALSQRLSETAIENIEPSKSGSVSTTAGLRKLIEIANADIDRICTQAAEFASDDHVDVVVRQQLATLIFDNAEMRKQLNAYTEGILMQTMERSAMDIQQKIGFRSTQETYL